MIKNRKIEYVFITITVLSLIIFIASIHHLFEYVSEHGLKKIWIELLEGTE